MKFFRHLLGITRLDKEKDQCILEKTRAESIVKEIKQYQEKWLKHVQRMETNKIPKQVLQYKPKGRRNIERPRKRWRDQFRFEDQGIKQYQEKWLQHVQRMDTNRIPKQALQYKAKDEGT
jgi:hypothetical protein